MAGPCPQGLPTQELHAKCQDRGSCTGPGCRVRRARRTDPLPAERVRRARRVDPLPAEDYTHAPHLRHG